MPENSSEVKKVVAQLTESLNSRNADVVSRRFGLKTGDKETLEAIGSDFGITRERVRQIQDASLTSIREQEIFLRIARPYVALAKNIIDESNGVIRESELFEAFSGTTKPSSVNASLVFLLTLDNIARRIPEDDQYNAFWASSRLRSQEFKQSVATFARTLKDHKEVIAQIAIADFVSQKEELDSIDEDTLHSYLSISKKVGKNVYGEIGLTKWASIKPRGVRDKSYLVLKKEGEPKHFRDIAQLINSTNFSDKKAHIQTVHNELIKDPRFILVGRGMYALSEWGYTKGTVKDIIAQIISVKGPMRKDDIVAHVMASRMVKPNTILLGMQDKKRFKEDEEGNVMLNQTQEI